MLQHSLESVKATVIRHLHNGDSIIRRHSSALKPSLTEANQLSRFKSALQEVKNETGEYFDMYDRIHVDEKWFYLMEDGVTYYLLDDEDDPVRTVRHKGHIQKVMFLCAVARPHGNFDGKIGIWPVGEQTPAARSSRNRPRGTLEWKSANLTRDKYRDMLIKLLLPAIKTKFPNWRQKN